MTMAQCLAPRPLNTVKRPPLIMMQAEDLQLPSPSQCRLIVTFTLACNLCEEQKAERALQSAIKDIIISYFIHRDDWYENNKIFT